MKLSCLLTHVQVVGKNWDDIVMKTDADVFIKMYAPWCGHCKAMAPAWEEFAQKMEGDDGIIVADFDATANDPGTIFLISQLFTIS